MATNHTQNYQLNLWEPQDDFLRAEFNENTEKLDAALKAEADARAAGDAALQTAVAAKADASTVTALTQTVNGKADVSALGRKFGTDNLPWVTGTYTGNAAETGEQHIVLGFRPRFLAIISGAQLGFAVTHEGSSKAVGSCSAEPSHGGLGFQEDMLVLTNDGFTVRRTATYQSRCLNVKDFQYLYFAIR